MALAPCVSPPYMSGNRAVGAAALATAQGKVAHTLLEALTLGSLCNGLVCQAVWL